jgi:4-diphosphocytidyl-2-C-methyl-D-erythritol kinase
VRWRRAPAKVNLTLRVIRRRDDGLHEIESAVAFGGVCDWLGFEAGPRLQLTVAGPKAAAAGPADDNFVLSAARALLERAPGLVVGRFELIKHLPAAAGLGGGSADAAAALRTLAEINDLPLDDQRIQSAARATGADVAVCLLSRARIMTGVGDRLAEPIDLPRLFALLVNPGVATSTRGVFDALGLPVGSGFRAPDQSAPAGSAMTLESFLTGGNDLEAPARTVAPVIATVLDKLKRLAHVKAARMSGSGSTCFALFESHAGAAAARERIASDNPNWWVRATTLR